MSTFNGLTGFDLNGFTITSSRPSVVGFYYFDTAKKAWFNIVEAQHVFTSFEFSFGCRWGTSHHQITKSKRAPAKVSEHIETCLKTVYNDKYRA
jgi:hypothetical protein